MSCKLPGKVGVSDIDIPLSPPSLPPSLPPYPQPHANPHTPANTLMHSLTHWQGANQWFELQDLHVQELLPQMITLAEAYIQVCQTALCVFYTRTIGYSIMLYNILTIALRQLTTVVLCNAIEA